MEGGENWSHRIYGRGKASPEIMPLESRAAAHKYWTLEEYRDGALLRVPAAQVLPLLLLKTQTSETSRAPGAACKPWHLIEKDHKVRKWMQSGYLELPAMTGANLNRSNTSSHLFKGDKWKTGPLTRGWGDGKRGDEWGTFRGAFKKLDTVTPRGYDTGEGIQERDLPHSILWKMRGSTWRYW